MRSSAPFIILLLLFAVSTLQAQGTDALRKAVTLYASFDKSPEADFARGMGVLSTRFNHETEQGKFVFEKGFDAKIYRIAKEKGIAGGALDPTDVLPRNGRVYFPAKDHLAFKKGGWSGAVSVWCNTDPNTTLKTKFCDPIQITQKGANDGGIWFDFNDAKPRDMRMGVFPAIVQGVKPATEADADAPMVRVPKVDWKAGQWHHVVLSWKNLDSGKADAVASMYVDGKHIGDVKDRPIAMGWDIDKAGIYVAVNYLGLLDELAVFERDLTAAEVKLLHEQPGFCAPLKKGR
jgi:hypothetical protein